MDQVLKGITQMAMPGDGKFNYPTDKKRTKQTTEAMITAEKNLDLFWSRFDVNWKRLAGKNISDCMGDHAPRQKGQQKERTAPWVEPVKEEKSKADPKDLNPKGWSDIKDDKILVTIKQKVKTKGIGQTTDIEEAAQKAPSAQVDQQPIFKVDKSSLKVFNTLFFTPGQAKAPGEIPWVDFLRAMGSTGFAAQKLYGSIWQFTPTKLDVERSIQFHEPHPAVKLRFQVARRMGRRLTRAYGWHGGMFELE
jgi:hypothetical protein